MTYQTKSRIVILLAILLVMIYSVFLMKIEFIDDRDRIVVANGVITGKYESDYACGSKGRYTCYSRYLTVDGKNHSVNLETFTSKNTGDSIVLTIEGDSTLSGEELLLMFFGIILWAILIVCILAYMIMFLWWSFFHSDRCSFMKYIND